MAFADVVAHGGDYFGPEVNLASRAVKESDPGQVVVTVAVAAALRDAARPTVPLGDRRLRGIEEPVALHLVGGPSGGDG